VYDMFVTITQSWFVAGEHGIFLTSLEMHF